MPRRAAVAVLLLAATAARGQQPLEPAVLRGDSPQTRKRLAEAEAKLLAGKAADAADDLQRVLDEAGDDLVGLDGKHFRPARLVAHGLLARLPADALKAYQNRVDAPAKLLLDAGARDRDPLPLWQLLDRYFVSRPAQDGGRLLGDLLFERGEFRAAELVWRRLLPDGSADLAHPTPPSDPAALRARVVLAVIFEHEFERAAEELKAFEARHAGAAGPVAGRNGPYAVTLRALLDSPPRLAPDAATGAWSTFGGGPDRAGRVTGPVPYRWPPTPTWRKPLVDANMAFLPGRLRPPTRHPVIVGGTVFVPGDRIQAFDLKTGDRTHSGGVRNLDTDAGGTLSAFAGRLFQRTGPAAVRPPEAKAGKADETALAAVARPDGSAPSALPLREAWKLPPPAAGENRGPAVWEGAPLAADGRLYAAFARFDGGRVAHALACYDPADAVTVPRPAWVTEVSDSPLSVGAEGRPRQELVTRAGRNVVLATNAGAVVAVDAATGKRAWGFAYPRAGKRANDASRSADPAPAVAAGGRVFVAPADADRVYALDAETGRAVWESAPVDGAQILGVTDGRVVITVTGPLRGARGLSVATGSHRPPEGWAQHDGGGQLTFGRGLVADGVVFWPTRSAGLALLNSATGYPLAPPLPSPLGPGGPVGNLAYADGVLVVVTATEVMGYVAEDRTPPPRSEPGPPRFDALLDGAERRLAACDRAGAEKLLLEAAKGSAAERARAAARLVLLTPPGTEEANLPPDVRALLTPSVRSEWLLTADGQFVTLRELLSRQAGRGTPARAPPAVQPVTPDVPFALGADARVRRMVPFPPATFPLSPVPGATSTHAFAASPQQITALPLAGGAPRRLPAADLFTHAADLGAGFVVAGPFAVAVYGAGDEAEWVFRLPTTDALPERPGRVPFRTGERRPPPHLSAFTLAGDWLLARVGEHHLVGLDLAGRRVGWVLGGHGRPRYEPVVFPGVPAFGPHLYAAGPLAAVQLSDGRRWFVNVATGCVCDRGGRSLDGSVPTGHGERTAGALWTAPPARLTGDRIAFSDGPGLVQVFRPSLDKTVWTYAATGDASLSGEPPRVRALGGDAFVLVRRNHGCELERLSSLDGTQAWEEPLFLDAGRIDLSAIDADASRLYVPVGERLRAFDKEDGSAAWSADLPKLRGAGGWHVRVGTEVVLAYPAEAIPDEPVADVWRRVVRSFARVPTAWRLPLLAETLADTWGERTVPVLLFDPETGELLKRVTLTARGPGVTAHAAGNAAVVVTGAGVTWLR
ncbi:outer membrane protein assembly factor BamB family protein [Urbifossiella limnaea]|uniref:Outer membrane biogenesis protein BamB n=1 Tax=Urbifossiella limnaea TaxID=2528023 RepID=A0A517XY96_9BACT|nr:PQQ-binding-like beta-propeller repeat protein [Urbifossiella limnaea]QDU22438.1 outer membrane biogenesis protein BamB [Urbifossiella limnaea]